jgi:2-oxoglutarate dehydrogenase E1 component
MGEQSTVTPRQVWQEFQGPNGGYLWDLYERYRKDPATVDAAARALFERWGAPQDDAVYPPPADGATMGGLAGTAASEKILAVANLAQSIRSYGHLAAQLDPLGSPPPGDPSLEPASHGLSEADLSALPASLVGGPPLASFKNAQADAKAAIQALKDIYCRTTGFDYAHILAPEERAWLRAAAENRTYAPRRDEQAFQALLQRLTQVEGFEQFLQRSFPGMTRFSIEGLDMLIPLLDKIVSLAAEADICAILLGMPHRGRLNVLAHILSKPYAQIFAAFKDPVGNSTAWQELGWTGDVKYHAGASSYVTSGASQGTGGATPGTGARPDSANGGEIRLVIGMPPNPSHLEYIDPVIEGMARAADCAVDRPGWPRYFPNAALPVLIHGDASFPGQGIVTETLNLAQLPGYQTGGTIHIIANNQLGFTATTAESRSSPYASDLARGLKIPILHVNADDPLACLEAAATAFAYRARFQKDFVIDLVGYRRYGHNEGDEPAFTQPVMYHQIASHPGVRQVWADSLVASGILAKDAPARLVKEQTAALQLVLDGLKPEADLMEPLPVPPPPGAARAVKTALPIASLAALNEALLALPADFRLNRKLERGRSQRRQAFNDPHTASVDWALAEELAFASLLQEGIAIRLAGQDAVRGTFSQRHAAFYDTETGQPVYPLHSVPGARAAFEIRNSPLSENAALGFEFGYNIQYPDRLVIWEAQYGDFANGAQGIIDEFITTTRAKWGSAPSLVLLLPHGNEGQGPDHSSARPERLLQLAAETNLRMANPTTAAQYYHLLRRQALLLKTDPLPLIILTPKGLLRHPRVSSRPVDLSEGHWQPIFGENSPGRSVQPGLEKVRRLLLCSGRVALDLAGSPQWPKATGTALARLEQIYPFPSAELEALLVTYPDLEELTWVQEEPLNMGVWVYAQPYLAAVAHNRYKITYTGRRPSPSPAEGSAAWYAYDQQALVESAFGLERGANGVVESGVWMERCEK